MSDYENLKNTLQIGISQDGDALDMLRHMSHFLEDVEVLGIAQKFDNEYFQISHVTGDAGEKLQGLKFTIGEGFLGHVVATSQPGYWSPVSRDPRAALFTRNGICPTSVFCHPVMQGQTVIGVLFGAFATEVTSATLALLEIHFLMFGRQIVIDSLEENLQVRNIRLSSIIELSQAIIAVQDTKNILYIILDMSLNLVQGPFTCIAFKSMNEESAIELLSRGMTREKAAQYGRELTDSYIGRKMCDLENQLVPVVRRLENTAVIECPLYFQDEVIAVLAVAVSNERKMEEFSPLVYLLSFIGGAALQRSYTAHVKDWTKDIALVHRTSAFWDKEAHNHALELQEIVAAFAKKLEFSCASIKFIEQAALLSPYEVEFVTDLLPGLADDVIQVLGDYRALCKPSETVPDHLTAGGQIIALAESHSGNTDIKMDAIEMDLREKFELFLLQKDVESQEILLYDAQQDDPLHADAVSLQELPCLEQLTAREQEVLKLLVKGRGNKEIAQTLFISQHTVKNHLTNIFQKLGVNDRTQAIALVYKYIQ